MMAAAHTPLWPAGHLPHKGGEHMRHALCAHRNARHALTVLSDRTACRGSISLLVGEMAGRPEGGKSAPLNVSSQEAR
ncbi:hypothetical protein N181_19160 [Sinorhizobium fredii USDA 205]|nr:hypothetical protein N181_19160 [Sinorhizobium fredii USDA 205]